MKKIKIKIPFTKKIVEFRSSLANPQEWLLRLLNGQPSKSGINVTTRDAIKISAVYACVKVIAETVAFLNCSLYRQEQRGKSKADNLKLYQLLHNLPNPETTAFDFWVMYIVNLLLTGDAFAYIKRDKNSKILEIWNIPTSQVTIYRNTQTNEVFYKVKDELGSTESVYYPENIMHTRGMRLDRLNNSLSIVELARDSMGLSIALEEYGSRYFANGAQVGGIVEYPSALSDIAFARFKDEFYKNYSGVINSNKVMFLEDGAKFTKVTNNPSESQALEARQFQIIEICRFFNVPPHKIMDLTRATFSNIEQQSIDFVQSCIGPMCARLEQTIYKDLLNESEKVNIFARFNLNTLLRGDSTARKDFYSTMIQNGVFSPNDVLELEDMNTYEGGDSRFINGAMVPVQLIEGVYQQKILQGGGNSGQNGAQNTTA